MTEAASAVIEAARAFSEPADAVLVGAGAGVGVCPGLPVGALEACRDLLA